MIATPAISSVEGTSAILDRRAVVRSPCRSQATVKSADWPEERAAGTGDIHDISAEGIGLVLGVGLRVGMVLELTLQNPANGFSRTVLAMVAHATPAEGGRWVAGCALLQTLSERELAALQ